MKLSDLEVMSGRDFHDKVMYHHICKDDDTPIYFLDDGDSESWYWLTICQSDDEDDGLWRGECDFCGYQFDDYEGRETPDEVLEMLMLKVQIYVAEEILAA